MSIAYSYSFFNFGLYRATILLFDVVMNVLHQEYYCEMGFMEILYDHTNKSFNKDLILNKIDQIIKPEQKEFPDLTFPTRYLNFDSLLDFIITFSKKN